MAGSAGQGDPSAPSRVLQGIVAGIGFIGGGVILHRRDSKGVHGLSTAASIWVVAAAGIAMGGGMWRTALVTVILALIILAGGAPIDDALRRARLRRRLSTGADADRIRVDPSKTPRSARTHH
jgi:putative Mg2+ transporter-C (MgtC) family protein